MIRNLIYAFVYTSLMLGIGYYLGQGNKQIEIQKEYIKGETITEIVEKTVTVEKIIRPDGTVEERTITENKNTNTDEKKTEISESTIKTIAQAQYSIGLQYHVDYKELFESAKEYKKLSRYEIIVGRRILGPAWVEIGSSTEQLTLGVRYEF